MSDATDEIRSAAAAGDFVEMFLEDRAAQRDRGLAEYLARFPGFETAVAREYLQLTQPPAAATASGDDDGGEMFGPYRTVRMLGQGGQGAVWLAEDTRLGRLVALKVLSAAGAGLSSARVERLRREAQALARLDHPGICAIYEAQLEGPQPWLAMRYVEGETLAALLAPPRGDQPQELPPRSRTQIAEWLLFFARAAEALHAAHALGILHRDVKPANLMRGRDGAPVVLDFGLARDLESTALSLTQSGELFGTLAYMSPEVLLGQPFDRRVDVYALGVTLFEVLARQRPFAGATHEALRRAIESGEATSLTDLAPLVSRDLALVVATALERDRDRRYSTAQALADDLRRVARGEPIAARPLGLPVRLRRTIVRHPVLATSVLLLLIGLCVALVLLAQVERGRRQLLALRHAYRAQSMSQDQPGTALCMVSDAAVAEPHPEINDILFQVLDRCWEEHAWMHEGDDKAFDSAWVATSDNDRLLAYCNGGGGINLVDLDNGRVARCLRHADQGPTTAAFCSQGRILTAGIDGVVRLFDVATGAERRSWQLHAATDRTVQAIPRLVVTADGMRAASCGSDGVVAVFAPDGDGVVQCRGHQGGIENVVFDPTGTKVATLGGRSPNIAHGDLTVRVFDAVSGRELRSWGPFAGPPRWIAWSHDGRRLAVARDERVADVYDVADGRTVQSLPHGGQVYWVEFGPGDRQLATGSPDGLSVFDADSGRRVALHGDFQDRSVFRGAFSPDGGQLAVIAWDDTARIYDTDGWQLRRTFRGVLTRALGLCWNHSGTRIATVGGGLQTWYAADRPFLPTLRGHKDRVVSAAFSPDGQRVLTASLDGDARIWDASRGITTVALPTGSPLRRACFSADGRSVLAIADGGPPSLFAPDLVRRQLGAQAAQDGWFYGDDRIVLAGADGVVRIHRRDTGELLHECPGHRGAIECAAFHPHKPWLATGGQDRTVRILDLDRQTLVHATPPWPPGQIGPNERVFGLLFDRAGARLFAACEDVRLRAFRIDDGFACTEVALGPTPGRMVAIDHDALLLVGGQWGGRVNVHRADTLATLYSAPAQHPNLIVALQLQPHGRLALSASRDGTVAIFDPVANVLTSTIHASTAPLLDAQWSPDGDRIVTAAADGLVRIWPADPLAVALRFRPTRPPRLTTMR